MKDQWTADDIATLAGVSVWTVRRAFRIGEIKTVSFTRHGSRSPRRFATWENARAWLISKGWEPFRQTAEGQASALLRAESAFDGVMALFAPPAATGEAKEGTIG